MTMVWIVRVYSNVCLRRHDLLNYRIDIIKTSMSKTYGSALLIICFAFINSFSKQLFFTTKTNVKMWQCCLNRRPREVRETFWLLLVLVVTELSISTFFLIWCFFFGWLLVAYCPLTSERNYPASNIIRCNVNFLKFKCCTSFYLIFCSFYVRIFRTEKTGITILQLHSVLLACVCEDRRRSAKMQRGAVHWFVTLFSRLNIYCGLLLADKAMQLGMRCVFYLVSCS